MAQIVSFIIQKGGCGKTTTTVNTASYLARQGYRVLAVDMDPQGNLTQHLGYDSDKLENGLLRLFLGERKFSDAVLIRDENLHVLSNNIEMTAIEFSLYKHMNREFLLRDALSPVCPNYDFILIDCPPNLGLLSINSLTASTDFVLTVSPEFFPMKAIKPLYDSYLTIRGRLNRTLQFKGVLMTMCDFRTRHAQDVKAILEKNFPNKLYRAFIRMNVALKEAASQGKSIFEYDLNSPGAFDYQCFAEEFLHDHGPTVKKKAFYEERFRQLPESEQGQILKFAYQSLSTFNRNRLDTDLQAPVLQEALIIERNKIMEKLFPYREHVVNGGK